MREDGKQQVCIVGLQECRVSDVEIIKELIDRGNEESSRSHAILQLSVKRLVDGSESKPPRVIGKLSFIDLAGSELVPSISTFENDTGVSWPELTDKDEYDEDLYEQEKPMWKKNKKLGGYNISNSEDKMKRENAQTK
ncbi:Kinesin-13A [Capsicum baccatum]|uniref:Kinesin-13A n=1 Tax=Capsicum baccatum TaxID=33114 RepID=A0A2G2WCF5_CAPBA|nr:Kinesin-13A [Capsicum baccatum]